ncbi:MAG: ABC-2 family transporter protein [Treponema sp.]|jgi:ABC-2 type transport system permease protein|nr:ABC-2 family transporter protein [Treponema sp.]
MNPIKQRLDVCKAVAFVTFKEWGAYRTHSMVSIFVGPVYFIVQYFIWTAVYGGSGTLGGIELSQMIRYFGATALIGYLTMDFADWNLDMLIRTGKYLTFALRPMNHRFFAFSQKVGHRILGFIVEFVPCTLIFILLFRIDMRPAYVGWLLVSIMLAYLMNFFVNYCLGMASFWIVQSDGIRSVYSLAGAVFSGMLIPLVFFPKPLQILQFFLPFQYTAYVPAMVFLGKYSLGGMELAIPVIVAIQAAAVLAVFIVSELMYNAAIKRFTAVGA